MPRKALGQSGGYVLIIVLVVCLGLVSLTLLFGHSMMMVYRGSETDLAGRQADRAIEGAVQYAEYLMVNNSGYGSVSSSGSSATGGGTGTNQGSVYYLPDPTLYKSEAVSVGDAAFWFIGEPATSDATTAPTFGLIDEASKLNLNTATPAMLQNLPNMTPNLAQAIITWRKTASSGTTSATTTTSSSQGAKGGQFESIYELAQVCGVDNDDLGILYGDDANLNHVLDAGETESSQFNPGIYEYVTVFSREPNTLPDGTKRVSVTTVSQELLTLLRNNFDSARVAQMERGIRTGGAIRSVVEFYIRSGMTADEFDLISKSLTMSTGTYATGLVNVNTASATVLQCIPGITQQLAQQLVSARTSQTQPYTNLAWIVPVIGNAAAIQAGPYLTTQTYQVTADVAAVGRYGRGYRRSLFVIDGSTGTPQIVYRHNMASLGWALGADALQTMTQQQGGQQSGQQKMTQ